MDEDVKGSASRRGAGRRRGRGTRARGRRSAGRGGWRSGDGAVADDELSAVEAGELPGRGALGGTLELDGEGAMAAGGEDGRVGETTTLQAPVRAHAHAVDVAAGAVQRDLAQLQPCGEQRLARPDGDGVRAGVGREHVQRPTGGRGRGRGDGRGDAEAAALADGVGVRARVLAERVTALVEDRAGPADEPAVAREEVALAGAGEEAEVLGLALARDRQSLAPGELAHLRLVHVTEREAQPRERARRERGEHVALVLALVGGGAQQRARVLVLAGIAGGRHARVVAGGERLRPERARELEHRVEAHAAVAAHARVGRAPVGVVGEPALDDAGAELRAQVDREMRHAELVRELARAAHGLRRAAALLGAAGAVDASAHRDERAPRVGRERRARARGGAERAVQRVGGELRGVLLGGAQPAELGGDVARADARCVEQRGAAHETHGGAAGCDRRAAAARVEARVGDAPVLAVGGERDRDAHEVAARGAAGRAGERVARPVPARERTFEVAGEQLLSSISLRQRRGDVHAASVGPGGPSVRAAASGADGARQDLGAGWRASAIACSIENASWMPVRTIALAWRLMTKTVGVASTWTPRVTDPYSPTFAAVASWTASAWCERRAAACTCCTARCTTVSSAPSGFQKSSTTTSPLASSDSTVRCPAGAAFAGALCAVLAPLVAGAAVCAPLAAGVC